MMKADIDGLGKMMHQIVTSGSISVSDLQEYQCEGQELRQQRVMGVSEDKVLH